MKEPDKHIENKIEDTLSSIDNVKRVSPRPFFYSRLKARLEREREGITNTEVFISPVLQPVLLTLLFLVFAVNIYTFGRMLDIPAEDATVSNEEALIEEYYPSTPTLFDITKPQSD